MTFQERNQVIAKYERLDPPTCSPDIEHECGNCYSNDVEFESALHQRLICNNCKHTWEL